MKKIPLTHGYFTLVDDEDYEWLSRYAWHYCKGKRTSTGYAATNIKGCNNKHKLYRMHRLILGLKKGDLRQVDHIDRNGLNNQKSNLRTCNNQQNSWNSKKRSGTSRYKGVTWLPKYQKWHAGLGLTSNEKRKHVSLGRYNNEREAARMYDLAALYYFGDFAKTNFDKSNYKDSVFDPSEHVGRFQPDNKGVNHGNSKLTEKDVIRIRQLAEGNKPQKEIAKMFGITKGLVSAIKRRAAWRHVDV